MCEPIPMLLWCPACGERHIDEGEFATKVHHTHSCQTCGLTWRPAVEPTTGVQFLPGFKNDTDEDVLEYMLEDGRQAQLMCGDPIDSKKHPLVAIVRRWKRWNQNGLKVVKLFPLIGQLERALAKQAHRWEVEGTSGAHCVKDLGYKSCQNPPE